MSRVFYARRIRWQSEDGSWNEQYGVPAIVQTSSKCQSRSHRRRLLHTAKLCGVALIPIQWGMAMDHGHEAVTSWLALCDGSDTALALMEQFLSSELVTWEHCVSLSIPCGKTDLGHKRKMGGTKNKVSGHADAVEETQNEVFAKTRYYGEVLSEASQGKGRV